MSLVARIVAAVALLVLGFARPAAAADELRLPRVFGDHMVLQRDAPVPVWGWARAGERVTVRIAGASAAATADAQGRWRATLPALPAGGPHVLVVEGPGKLRFEDVLVGEVWLCSGQSNMEMGIAACRDAKAEIAAADHPRLRLLTVPNRFDPSPRDDFAAAGPEGTWKVCTPASVAEGGWAGFPAAAYHFGRDLEKALDVPVGLIDATWGGTRIEPWTPAEGYAAVPALADEHARVLLADATSEAHRERLARFVEETERWAADARRALAARTPAPPAPAFPPELLPPRDQQSPTALWNGMIHPVCPFAIRGAIWYQGESNLADGPLYTERMRALVSGWRARWGQGDFPFHFVQIAPFRYGGDPLALPRFWEAQAAALSIPGTGMAVTIDIGNLADIHPVEKREVGRRLGLLALAGTYGRKVVSGGPAPKSVRTEGPRLRVTFDSVGGGLVSADGKPLAGFEVIDADEGGFVPAEARIDGASVVLSAAGVKRPVAARLGWNLAALPNLANREGLPAAAFRAGALPDRDPLAKRVAEAKDYTLVYDLDLTKLGPALSYDVDARASVTRPFDRIAYALDLRDASGDTRFVWVSMDAFTDDLGRIGVPTSASGARFQRDVARMNVVTNVRGVAAGNGLDGGSIEFWPDNYSPRNAAGVPGASDTVWDFGDEPVEGPDGYGSMQVHNHAARQTVLALNHWTAGAHADVGIGNQPSGNPDWTFAANASSWTGRRLRVLVRCR